MGAFDKNPRRVARHILERVLYKEAYSHIALGSELDRRDVHGPDRGLITEIVYGTLCWRDAIDRVLDDVVNGGTRRLDDAVLMALRVAVYQWLFLDRIPDHAILNDAVEDIKRSPSKRASGLVNGVLRSLTAGEPEQIQWWRDEDRDSGKIARYLSQRYSLPGWLANRIWQGAGDADEAEAITRAFNTRPSLWARGDAAACEGAAAHPDVPMAWRLEDGLSDDVRAQLEAGTLGIQDIGSQLVGWMTLPSPQDGEGSAQILDACAGLGGKTLQLHALAAAGKAPRAIERITAVEPLATKLEMLRQAPRRDDGPALEVFEGTLAEFAAQTDARFDVVLIDAPCTGLGTMRRHPETRWRRTEADIRAMAELQQKLLAEAAELVAPQGILLYSVCTFTHEEGPRQIERFLETDARFARVAPPEIDGLDWTPYLDEAGCLVTSPHRHDSDAFFAARLKRRG